MLSSEDISTLLLTAELAAFTTLLLLLVGIPLAWWLSQKNSLMKNMILSLVSIPIVLPPTVIGFYLLIAYSPSGFIGELMTALDLPSLAFTFTGLVIGSMIFSLPFVVQPLVNSFSALPKQPLEIAATLGASPLDRFFSMVLPLSKSGLLTASVLGFAHTVGEFGVVLMIGGSIPGETKVASIQLYDHVEALNYSAAHGLSLVLLAFSFISLFLLFSAQKRESNDS